MKQILTLLVLGLFVVSVVPVAFAINVGSGITPDIITEDFEPKVWMCGDRVVLDDATEPGRISNDSEDLTERTNNYAFEGEQIGWEVLVMDKNGIEKIVDVFGTIGSTQGAGNDIEVNCDFVDVAYTVDSDCNAHILEEDLTGADLAEVAGYYSCTLTVETPDSMYGEYWLTVEAEDIDGLTGTMAENEYWFLNPVIALSIDGDLTFDDVRPGTLSYSETLLVGNDADDGSGVLLDMFISGTDFYDSSSSGAMCPTSNTLELDNFAYFVTNGGYSSITDSRGSDVEGYLPIAYGIGFNDPNPFYGTNELLQEAFDGTYWQANTLTPGAEAAVTFRLALPEPCNGDFDTGSIFFWGEAI
ncbi:hypothetical protein CMI47_17595 [Candidatus Pacearchaeota archaeon]|nr:hypothetical protein [Candidatus Pacearchaeota archaeon]|tara:strand:+ start:284 stop:1357 length:1074 start_codon:yes stop_codon:yes gene_type:complete